MNLKRILIILTIAVIGGFLYLFPQMLNQRSYNEYFLFEPSGVQTTDRLPLILYLHGSGSRGVDSDELAEETILEYARQNDTFPFMVVAPVCDEGDSWHPTYLMRFLDTLITKYPVDTNRIYLTGLSMGGVGVWDLAMHSPNTFAALAPVCGRFKHSINDVGKLINTPAWAFHGEKDEIVPFEGTQKVIDTLKSLGAEAKLTLFPDLGHLIWVESYDNPELYEWFLNQSR